MSVVRWAVDFEREWALRAVVSCQLSVAGRQKAEFRKRTTSSPARGGALRAVVGFLLSVFCGRTFGSETEAGLTDNRSRTTDNGFFATQKDEQLRGRELPGRSLRIADSLPKFLKGAGHE